MKAKYILAHDVGTSSDKAVLTNFRGRVLHKAQADYPVYYPQPGWAEQDPDELWRAVARTTRQVIHQAGIDAREIAGVALSAQMFNLLPLDTQNRPVTRMLSWLDTRSTRQADQLLQQFGGKFFFQYTGNIPTAKDVIPKIVWLKAERADLWQRTAQLCDIKEYLLYRLTGKLAIDWHGASAMFLLDPQHRIWSSAVCDAIGLPIEKLPPLYPSTAVIGPVTREAGRITGLHPGTPVVICGGDVGAAQVGAGAVRENQAHLCIGTATWIGFSTPQFVNDASKPLWGLCHLDPKQFIIAGEMETGGGALMWFRDVFAQEERRLAKRRGISTYALLSEMANAVEPGSDGLIFLPWLSGERAPILNHYARGGFLGIQLDHTKAHFTRAVMEGVAFHLRWIGETLENLGFHFDTLNAIGGGSTSRVWMQIIADVTGKCLRPTKFPQEAGAMGAAITGAVGLGVYDSLTVADDLVGFGKEISPRASRVVEKRYATLFDEYRSLYFALAPIFHRRESE